MNGLQSELMKYKRTFTRKLIVFIPLFFAVQASAGVWLMPEDTVRTWNLVTAMIFNVWTVVFLAFGMALFAVLADSQERKSGNYRALRSHKTSPAYIWVNKVLIMAVHTLLATFVLVIATILTGFITAAGEIPWVNIVTASLVSWLVTLVLIPIQLWAATWKGMFLSTALGFVGFLAGILSSPTSHWIAVPWSWAIRLMSPVVGVHPNGTLLESGDRLLNASVIPIGIVVSLSAFVIITAITAVWFTRREII